MSLGSVEMSLGICLMVSKITASKSGGNMGDFQCSRFLHGCKLSLSQGLHEGVLKAMHPVEQQQAALSGLSRSAAGCSLGDDDLHI